MTQALLPANVDYTDVDKAALDVRLKALISVAFPTWTDLQRANFGNLLVELFNWNGDVLTFYQCKQALEAFIAWAVQRRSMIALGRVVAYTPRSAAAATVDETFSIPTVMAGTVTFPAGTTCRTKEVTDPKVFQLLAALVIPAGSTSTVGSIENSDAASDAFTSDGTPNQTFTLTDTPYLDDSAVVTVGAEPYTQVDDFLGSTATSAHFTLSTDQDDRAKITFGNGVNGKIPPVGAFTVAYTTGGGSAGNVEAATITKLDGTFTDSVGTSVVVSVTNPLAADGGEERESVEAMRLLIPASVRAQTRCISREDFEIAALLVPGVGRALMLSAIEDVGIPENRGWLYIVPPAGGVPATVLKAAVLVAVTVTRPGPTSFETSVLDPVYLTINVYARVWCRQGYTAATVGASIRAALIAWFLPNETDGTPNTTVDFGWNMKDVNGDPANLLAWSDIFDVVKDTVGVLRMGAALADFTLNGSHDNVAIDIEEFPKLGTVTLVDGATGFAM